jgi:hypothetical protein
MYTDDSIFLYIRNWYTWMVEHCASTGWGTVSSILVYLFFLETSIYIQIDFSSAKVENCW